MGEEYSLTRESAWGSNFSSALCCPALFPPVRVCGPQAEHLSRDALRIAALYDTAGSHSARSRSEFNTLTGERGGIDFNSNLVSIEWGGVNVPLFSQTAPAIFLHCRPAAPPR